MMHGQTQIKFTVTCVMLLSNPPAYPHLYWWPRRDVMWVSPHT